jgi:hypothetical protein
MIYYIISLGEKLVNVCKKNYQIKFHSYIRLIYVRGINIY